MIDKLPLRTILKIASPYIPKIRQEAAPFVEQTLSDILREAENELRLGESYASIAIVKQAGKVRVCLCTMSEDNKWLRTLDCRSTEELTEMLLNSLLKNTNEI